LDNGAGPDKVADFKQLARIRAGGVSGRALEADDLRTALTGRLSRESGNHRERYPACNQAVQYASSFFHMFLLVSELHQSQVNFRFRQGVVNGLFNFFKPSILGRNRNHHLAEAAEIGPISRQ
jgi:hypothetical protein